MISSPQCVVLIINGFPVITQWEDYDRFDCIPIRFWSKRFGKSWRITVKAYDQLCVDWALKQKEFVEQ